jgi:two-component system, cell cycle sensor histidine kinase and response regulator CckA
VCDQYPQPYALRGGGGLMPAGIDILHLEDDDLDAELIRREIEARVPGGAVRRAGCAEEFATALAGACPDLVLADYRVPGCEHGEIVEMARRRCPGVPVILVSGVIGEEAAVEALRRGATDYVLKDRLSRLAPAVVRAVEEAKVRRERKVLGNQLTRAQRLEIIGEMAAGMAHDFNNLLTIVMVNCGLLDESLEESSTLRRFVRQIEHAAEHGATLANRLLLLGRDEPGKIIPVDMNLLVERACHLLRRVVPERILIEASTAEPPPVVRGDPAELEQVLVNLVLNARDAIAAGGTVHIETGRGEDAGGAASSFLRVSDTGQGMAEDVKTRLFEPFFTTKAPGHGSGLGLATCHRIIESLGGSIEVASVPGEGSVFTVHLPPAGETPLVDGVIHPTATPRVGTGTILLAEDDHALRDLMAGMLEGLGYRVVQAAHGLEALEADIPPTDPRPILLVADIVLPMLGGLETARLLRARHPGMKVLFTTGHSDAAIACGGGIGPDAMVLRKPFTLPELAAKVHALTGGGVGAS